MIDRNQQQAKNPYPFQDNERRGWIYMMIYWACSLWIGIRFGYAERLKNQVKYQKSALLESRPFSVIVAVLILSKIQSILNTRYTSNGRNLNPIAIVSFSIINGISETFTFIACYDAGTSLAYYPLKAVPNKIIGFIVLTLYLALSHAFFWAPYALPNHVKVNAPPFHKHALLPLIALTYVLILPYMLYSDILVMAIIHVSIDAAFSINMKLPGPF